MNFQNYLYAKIILMIFSTILWIQQLLLGYLELSSPTRFVPDDCFEFLSALVGSVDSWLWWDRSKGSVGWVKVLWFFGLENRLRPRKVSDHVKVKWYQEQSLC